MSNNRKQQAMNLINASFWAHKSDESVWLTNGSLSFVESVDESDKLVLTSEQRKFLEDSRRHYDGFLVTRDEAGREHLDALAELGNARRKAEENAQKFANANAQLTLVVSEREEEIARVRKELEATEKYQIARDRQNGQFVFARLEAYRFYILAIALIVAFVYTREQSIGAALIGLISIVANSYAQQITSIFGAKERDEQRSVKNV